jgi:hypothetical protein
VINIFPCLNLGLVRPSDDCSRPYDLGIVSLSLLSVDLRPNAPSIRVLITLSIYILLACLAQDRLFLFRAGFASRLPCVLGLDCLILSFVALGILLSGLCLFAYIIHPRTKLYILIERVLFFCF